MSPAAAAAAAPETVAAPPTHGMDIRQVPIELVHESALNPRKHWSEQASADLEASIRKVGILTPLLVRPVTADGRLADPKAAAGTSDPGARDHYELAAGHRRRRAAAAAGLAFVPVQVRYMDDAEFREVLIIENLQRADIHPLDEADAYAAILKHDKAYTVEALAARVGKSVSYVYKRLKLAQLEPACREAFFAEEITAAHAERLARLTAKQQEAALKACFLSIFGVDRGNRETAPVSRLDDWIHDNVELELKVTEDLTYYQPDFAAALGQEPEADKLIQLSGAYYAPKVKAVTRDKWKEIEGKKDRCEHVQRGVIVHGGAPRILDVCVKVDCQKHRPYHQPIRSSEPAPRHKPTPAELKQREKERREREEREAWRKLEARAITAFKAHVRREPPAMSPALVEAVIGDYELKRTLKELGAKKVTTDNMGAALALFTLDTGADTYDPASFTKFAKPFGFDVGAFVREHAPKPKGEPKKVATERSRPAVTKPVKKAKARR